MKWRRNKKAWINRYHIHHNIISLCLYFLCRPVNKKFFAGAGVGDTSAWEVLLRLLWTVFRRMRGGTTVPLLAGAGPVDTSVFGGTLTFNVTNLPSDPWWTVGSAYNLSRDILYVWRY